VSRSRFKTETITHIITTTSIINSRNNNNNINKPNHPLVAFAKKQQHRTIIIHHHCRLKNAHVYVCTSASLLCTARKQIVSSKSRDEHDGVRHSLSLLDDMSEVCVLSSSLVPSAAFST